MGRKETRADHDDSEKLLKTCSRRASSSNLMSERKCQDKTLFWQEISQKGITVIQENI